MKTEKDWKGMAISGWVFVIICLVCMGIMLYAKKEQDKAWLMHVGGAYLKGYNEGVKEAEKNKSEVVRYERHGDVVIYSREVK